MDVSIPLQMTTSRVWETMEAGDGQQLGYPLTRRMTAYLDNALAGLTVEQRMEQLGEVNAKAARAWTMYRQGDSPETIARALHSHRATAYRLLAFARGFLSVDLTPEPETEDERWEYLQANDPRAFLVALLMGHYWGQQEIADHLCLSIDQVKKARGRAMAVLGGEGPVRMGRYRRMTVR